MVTNAEGQGDIVRVWYLAGTDAFDAYPTRARLPIQDAYTVFAYGAQYVYATATPGGSDVARLYAKTQSQDELDAYPTYSKLYGPNNSFYYRANSFRYVYATATGGGDDTASLLDDLTTAGTFEGRPTYSKMYGPGNSYYYRANSFPRVFAFATGGGDDTTDITEPLDFTLDLIGDRDR